MVTLTLPRWPERRTTRRAARDWRWPTPGRATPRPPRPTTRRGARRSSGPAAQLHFSRDPVLEGRAILSVASQVPEVGRLGDLGVGRPERGQGRWRRGPRGVCRLVQVLRRRPAGTLATRGGAGGPAPSSWRCTGWRVAGGHSTGWRCAGWRAGGCCASRRRAACGRAPLPGGRSGSRCRRARHVGRCIGRRRILALRHGDQLSGTDCSSADSTFSRRQFRRSRAVHTPARAGVPVPAPIR